LLRHVELADLIDAPQVARCWFAAEPEMISPGHRSSTGSPPEVKQARPADPPAGVRICQIDFEQLPGTVSERNGHVSNRPS
jgi:hypothetical protein